MKKLLTSLLCVVMVVCFMPGMAWAEGEAAPAEGEATPVMYFEVTKGEITQSFPTADAAVNSIGDGETAVVKLLNNYSGGGVKVNGKNITFDLDGKIWILADPTVGSAGTETNGFQFLKGANVTIKNGTIALPDDLKCAYLFQNYANLTLDNLNVDINNNGACMAVLHSMNGSVHINGNTNLTAEGSYTWSSSDKGDKKAIAVGDWSRNPSYIDGTQVYVNTTGTIKGQVNLSAYIGTNANPTKKSTLEIQSGNIIGDIVEDQYVEEYGVKTYIKGGSHTGNIITQKKDDGSEINSQISITGGDFSTNPKNYVPEGNTSVALKSDTETTYYVGTDTDVADAVKEAVKSGDEITVQKGNVALKGIPNGVKVTNEAGEGSSVSVNGTPVTGTPVETYTPVYIPPTTQTPTIDAGENATVTLSDYGTKATIKVADGYELVDVTVNGESKGKVDTLTGLKTGDKVVVTTKKIEAPVDPAAEAARIKAGVENTTLKIYSGASGKGDGWIQIRWVKSKGFKVDGYEVYRGKTKSSMKKYDTTKKTSYKNAKYLKKGNRYYYKVRGYRMVGDEKVYTNWSKTIYRIAK